MASGRMESDMDTMGSAKISFHTQEPKKMQKSTLVHGNAVGDLHDEGKRYLCYVLKLKRKKKGRLCRLE